MLRHPIKRRCNSKFLNLNINMKLGTKSVHKNTNYTPLSDMGVQVKIYSWDHPFCFLFPKERKKQENTL